MTALFVLGILPLLLGAFLIWVSVILDDSTAGKLRAVATATAVATLLGITLFVFGLCNTITAIVYLSGGQDIP